jgi:hypothetical protein
MALVKLHEDIRLSFVSRSCFWKGMGAFSRWNCCVVPRGDKCPHISWISIKFSASRRVYVTGVEANFISVCTSPVTSRNGQIKLYLLLLDLSHRTKNIGTSQNVSLKSAAFVAVVTKCSVSLD